MPTFETGSGFDPATYSRLKLAFIPTWSDRMSVLRKAKPLLSVIVAATLVGSVPLAGHSQCMESASGATMLSDHAEPCGAKARVLACKSGCASGEGGTHCAEHAAAAVSLAVVVHPGGKQERPVLSSGVAVGLCRRATLLVARHTIPPSVALGRALPPVDVQALLSTFRV